MLESLIIHILKAERPLKIANHISHGIMLLLQQLPLPNTLVQLKQKVQSLFLLSNQASYLNLES